MAAKAKGAVRIPSWHDFPGTLRHVRSPDLNANSTLWTQVLYVNDDAYKENQPRIMPQSLAQSRTSTASGGVRLRSEWVQLKASAPGTESLRSSTPSSSCRTARCRSSALRAKSYKGTRTSRTAHQRRATIPDATDHGDVSFHGGCGSKRNLCDAATHGRAIPVACPINTGLRRSVAGVTATHPRQPDRPPRHRVPLAARASCCCSSPTRPRPAACTAWARASLAREIRAPAGRATSARLLVINDHDANLPRCRPRLAGLPAHRGGARAASSARACGLVSAQEFELAARPRAHRCQRLRDDPRAGGQIAAVQLRIRRSAGSADQASGQRPAVPLPALRHLAPSPWSGSQRARSLRASHTSSRPKSAARRRRRLRRDRGRAPAGKPAGPRLLPTLLQPRARRASYGCAAPRTSAACAPRRTPSRLAMESSSTT